MLIRSKGGSHSRAYPWFSWLSLIILKGCLAPHCFPYDSKGNHGICLVSYFISILIAVVLCTKVEACRFPSLLELVKTAFSLLWPWGFGRGIFLAVSIMLLSVWSCNGISRFGWSWALPSSPGHSPSLFDFITLVWQSLLEERLVSILYRGRS